MGRRGSFALALLALTGCGDNFHPGGGSLLVSPQLDLRTTEAGGTAVFSVQLTNEPAGMIDVEIASMDEAEGTVTPAVLTFDRDNYDDPRSVTITGVDDARADGNQSYIVRIAAPRIGAVDLDITNQDDDTAGFMVTPLLGLMTTEAGDVASFDVSLTSQPAAGVTVPVASADPSEGMTDVATLTFSEDNWDVAQRVRVQGQQDAAVDGTVSYVVVLGPADSADAAYKGLDPDDVAVQNVDDDIRGIAVVAPASLATSEAGTADSFTVVLQTQPSADVTIDVATSDAGEAGASVTQLVFTPASWDQPQTVTVTGANDFVDDGDQPFTITLAAATSSDATYDGIDPDDVGGTNADDDTAAIVVTPTTGLTTSESGTSDIFTVVLATEPAANVTIAVTTGDATEGTPTPMTLTFTPASWDQPQSVTVIGEDDLVSDGDVAYTIVLAPAVSADGAYAGLDPADVSLINSDNDLAGVTIEPTTGVVVSEFGDTDTFTIVLDTAPTADVIITLNSSDTGEGTVQPSSVTFTPANWFVPQTVTVTGIDDNLADGNIDFSIVTGDASSADAAYAGLAVPDALVTNIDNDTAQVYVKARRRLQVSENGQSATFRVSLTIPPAAAVSCTLSSSDTSEVAVSPTTLLFTPNDFGFQNVTVSGVDDAVVDGDVLVTIILAACTSTDPAYSGSNPRDVTVINRDND